MDDHTDSTVIDANDASVAAGNGAPALAETVDNDSVGAVLEAELKSIREAEAKPAEGDTKAKADKAAEDAKAKVDDAEAKPKAKPAPDPKMVAEGDGKPDAAPAPKSDQQQEQPADQQRGRHIDPPARFLPEARTKWANVPNEIKSEFNRVSQEYEAEIADHRRYREELREYDEMAKGYGTTLKSALDRYRAAETALQQSFGRGVAMLAQQAGRNPAQAIAEVISGFGITPQQYVEAIQRNPQLAMAPQPAHQQRPSAPPPQQPQIDPGQIKDQIRREMTAEAVVASFAEQNPGFADLSAQVKGILDSGVIDRIYGTGLSLEQKLAEAYRMAGGSPSIQSPAAEAAHSEPDARPVKPDAGKKSVRGAPANGEDAASDEPETDLRELLKKEMKKLVA